MPIKTITFGCRLNTYESEVIKTILKDKIDEKEIIIFNTCTVTNEAEKQLQQSIRKHKKENPDSIIAVVGCAIETNRTLYETMSEVDYVLGNKEKMQLVSYLQKKEINEKYKFETPLIDGIIISRLNRFIFDVKIKSEIIKCYCPNVGKIGNVIFKNIPCLLSKSDNKNRKMEYSVEAISLNERKNWIGINQNMANRFVEFFLKTNQLNKIIDFKGNLKREVAINNSKLDFIVENNYIEVKTPLTSLFPKYELSKKIEFSKETNFVFADRMLKHLNELENNLEGEKKAIMIILFMYEAKPFKPSYAENNEITIKIKQQVKKAMKNGVEIWQLNLEIDKEGVCLREYFKLMEDSLFEKKSITMNTLQNVNTQSQHLITGFENRSRAFIQIQNGCDNFCTFCATRLARGSSVSIEPSHIIKQINLLKDYKEIVLTGIDITDYGKGISEKMNLGQLIRKILKETDLPRLRVSSLDIADMNDDLRDILFNETRVMPHIHLSLQSGDDTILKRMNRRHNRQQIIDFCNEIRKYRDNVGIGADFIAGFPTETNEMHKNTCALIKEINVVFGHIFPYSIRENTAAAKMEQVPINTRKERSKEIRDICAKQLANFTEEELKKPQKILVESENTGRTENYLIVKLNGKYKINEIVDYKL
ncbi:MAG: DNA/RNA nuclease SfsA [Rickettsiales bacterium]|jgi:threonylcarbamoyladenosine tRNA methylthiotransferase MtaB|nr:DNA/RNA nuclease SfsA [Rickettsiales bacterium]